MAIVVSFISEKGGVGKTTTCYHIGVALARSKGKRVLFVDADYQRGGLSIRIDPSLSSQFKKGVGQGTTLFHKFQQLYSASQQSKDIDIISTSNGYDLIPADPRLSSVTQDKLPSASNVRENTRLILRHLQVINYVLRGLYKNYDYVLIDSHPEVSDVLRSIIYASDYCISPVKLDRQSSIGVATIIAEIKAVNDDVKGIQAILKEPKQYKRAVFAGAIGMMCREYDGIPKNSELTEYNLLKRQGKIFNGYVTEGDGLRKAAAYRCPVYDLSFNNARKQSGQYARITNEFLAFCK